MSRYIYVLSAVAMVMVNSQVWGAAEGAVKNHRADKKATHNLDVLEERKAQAKQLVEEAVQLYQKEGRAAFEIIGKRGGKFCKKVKNHHAGVCITSLERDVLVSCKYPGLVGKNDLDWKAPDGSLSMKSIAEAARNNPQGTFVTYITNVNPHSEKPSPNTVYVRLIDGLMFAASAYHLAPSHCDLPPAENVALYVEEPTPKS